MKRFTTATAKSLSKPGIYRADPTLYLAVAPGGSKSWIQRITIDSKRRDLGLGPFPVISLAKARERAFANRVAIADGRNPLAEKRKIETPTFREAAKRTYETNRPRWRSEKVAAKWWQAMEKHAFPALGDMRVHRIGREDVLRVLMPLWTSRPEQARKLRRSIRSTLAWCQASGFVEINVAGEIIDAALPAQPAVKHHMRALDYRKVGSALQTVEASPASLSVRLCFRFVVLTACRGGEARLATWDEVDEDARLWVIPGTRMKGGVEHRQPLSAAALGVLEQARALDDGSGLLFPSPVKRGRPLSDMSLTKVLRDTGLANKTTIHGMRTCFRTWASEKTNSDHAVMEMCLAHQVGSAVERAYARSDLLAKRRRLMDQWCKFVRGADGAQVIPFRG